MTGTTENTEDTEKDKTIHQITSESSYESVSAIVVIL